MNIEITLSNYNELITTVARYKMALIAIQNTPYTSNHTHIHEIIKQALQKDS